MGGLLPSGPPLRKAVPDPMIRPVPTAPPSLSFVHQQGEAFNRIIRLTAIMDI